MPIIVLIFNLQFNIGDKTWLVQAAGYQTACVVNILRASFETIVNTILKS